jgi:DNA invertase Pin-like site-specific DNA recombinase
MTEFAGIAEFERSLIRERTGAGRVAAKKRGVKLRSEVILSTTIPLGGRSLSSGMRTIKPTT